MLRPYLAGWGFCILYKVERDVGVDVAAAADAAAVARHENLLNLFFRTKNHLLRQRKKGHLAFEAFSKKSSGFKA